MDQLGKATLFPTEYNSKHVCTVIDSGKAYTEFHSTHIFRRIETNQANFHTFQHI
jgi:hypothetical protein